jgi:hypothetical protein
MEADRRTSRSTGRHWPQRFGLPLMVTAAAAILGWAATLVSEHTIRIVQARRLLPRWDLATHLGHGWVDYHLLATGQIPRLLWDFWLQGYWPPALSIYQIPFYLLLGAGIGSGLRSGLAAFVLTGVAGCAVLWRQWKAGALLPAAIFVALLISSPYLLAYASLAMTETLGAFVQLVVLLCYVLYRESPDPRRARWFALSLTALFFTKYNYFFLMVVPLAVHEWLERTSSWQAKRRWTVLALTTGRVLVSPAGALVALYSVFLVIILRTGGFEFHLLGRLISVHTIGNSGHIVFYALLARLWYLHHHRRIDWRRLASFDPRVRPVLVWFALPVTIWLAAPYPNHIRDFANLVINRPLGEASVGTGIVVYLDALRTEYFYSEWILGPAIAAFVVAAIRYRRQPPWMRWLIVAIPLQSVAVALHQTRFPRFLLLTVVLLCLAASSEVGRWFASTPARRVAGIVAAAILALGVVAARQVVGQEGFRRVAFENYTDNQTLRDAIDSIRADLDEDDRLAIVGQSNELSPALFRWELGPPAGVSCFPFEIGGARGVDLGLATRVLLLTPLGPEPTRLDLTGFYLAQRQAVLERVERGDFHLAREIPLTDMNVAMRLYQRGARTRPAAPCQ